MYDLNPLEAHLPFPPHGLSSPMPPGTLATFSPAFSLDRVSITQSRRIVVLAQSLRGSSSVRSMEWYGMV